ncbi:MAG: homoserine dehydrogenase, partial [Clostridia bacterium]|nr:homoserine dehydrogenase [Clostridia bacterium]
GGIPVIRPMMNDLSSNRIDRISGILNGTTNYILTAMRDRDASFDEVLKEAQALGYAEANPSADVDGIDAARKIVILAALATGKLIDPKTIPTEGITAITLTDTKLAAAFGYTMKLIGYAETAGDKLLACVSPRLIPAENPLCRIDGVLNGILLNANMVGEVMFYGPGAGKLPTASAVVADIIDVIAGLDKPVKAIRWSAATTDDLSDFSELRCRRMIVVKGELPSCLSAYPTKTADGATACLTDEMSEAEVHALLCRLGDSKLAAYRVL